MEFSRISIPKIYESGNLNRVSMFNNIKAVINENYPGFFDQIKCNEAYQTTLEFIKDDITLFKFYYTSSNDKYCLNIGIYNYSTTENLYLGAKSSPNTSDSSSYGGMYCENFIYEVILINKNAFGLSFINDTSSDTKYRSPGIVIFAKTENGEIAVVQPSHCRGVGKSPNSYCTENYLEVITKYSIGTDCYFPSIYFTPTLNYQTVVSPVMVYGNDDYVPNCYWISMLQFEIDKNNDGIIEIGGMPFYCNGFIAVKLDS